MTDVVTLDQARAHLRFPDAYTADDDMLSSILIPAATSVCVREAGDVVPVTYDEFYNGGDYVITARHKPILSVESLQEDRGFTVDTLTEQQVNTTNPTYYGFSIDLPESGVISRRALNHEIQFWPGVGNVHLVYTAGRAETPANIQLVALQIIAYWYQGFLQRQAGTDATAVVDTDFPTQGSFTPENYGVPEWLLELLKPTRRAPIIG